MKVFLKQIQILLAVLLLAACGGGDSDSDGGGSQKYNGTQRLFASAPGVAPIDGGTIGITIEISGDDVKVIDPDAIFKGKLKNKAFIATGSFVLGDIGNGIICGAVNLSYSGVVDGALITGSLAGNVNCTSAGQTIPISFSGTFKASAVAKQYATDSLKDLIKAAL